MLPRELLALIGCVFTLALFMFLAMNGYIQPAHL